MRSPRDVYEGPKTNYLTHLFDDDDYLCNVETEKRHINIFYRILRAFFSCCKFKGKRKSFTDDMLEKPSFTQSKTMLSSFAENELRSMIHQRKNLDVAVQTGDSLEMSEQKKNLPLLLNPLPLRPLGSIDDHHRLRKVVTSNDNINKHLHELNMLKFCKEYKSDHEQSGSRISARNDTVEEFYGILEELDEKPSLEVEEELHSHYYDSQAMKMPGPSHKVITTTCDIHLESPKTSAHAKKCLRFEEETVEIPSVNEEDDDEEYEESKNITVDRKKKDHDADDSPQGTGGGRDFKRFWKSKKSKKRF